MFKPVEVLRDFMRRFRVEFVSFVACGLVVIPYICQPLQSYDLYTRLFGAESAKINQPNISMHGREEWEQLYINSRSNGALPRLSLPRNFMIRLWNSPGTDTANRG